MSSIGPQPPEVAQGGYPTLACAVSGRLSARPIVSLDHSLAITPAVGIVGHITWGRAPQPRTPPDRPNKSQTICRCGDRNLHPFHAEASSIRDKHTMDELGSEQVRT